MLRKRNGQSILEYVVIFTVVVAAVVAFVAGGAFDKTETKGLGKLLKASGDRLGKDSQSMVNSLK